MICRRERRADACAYGQSVAGEGRAQGDHLRDQIGPLLRDRAVHDAGIAYLADLGMNPVILLPHGYSWRDERITEASLDHTMWFHRPARADEWLSYQQRVEVTRGGRGLARGLFHDTDGQLIATSMQEGLMRWHP